MLRFTTCRYEVDMYPVYPPLHLRVTTIAEDIIMGAYPTQPRRYVRTLVYPIIIYT